MWMMGYNDGGDMNSRRLRPLIPRPVPNNNTNTSTTSRIHGSDIFSQYHQHLASMSEQSKREFNTPQVVVSSRWNPTPEQLRALEELYRQGTRTPSAEQIQHITGQLKRYGKIEGKNVFYWFQNHKARERQKRRRQMESAQDEINLSEKNKDLGASRTVFEVEQTKNWVASTNCSTTLAEESHVSIQRAAKAAMAECRTDGWIHLGEGELLQRRNLAERNATWQMMQLSCPSFLPTPTHLINASTAAPATTRTEEAARKMDQMVVKTTHDLSIFITPYRDSNGSSPNHLSTRLLSSSEEDKYCSEESQTLELFPLRSGNSNETLQEKSPSSTMENVITPPSQFFEFLPLKN
ncbi:hypothetical protein UlMin_008759 [Ulmus minor]